MIIAAKSTIQNVTNRNNSADAVNAAVVAISGGRLPCYAIPGKRVPFKWVSVGSSAVISRSVAEGFLARVGVNIDEVEAA